ncbi:hypothetical protein PNP85_05460 [Halobacterium salinarum]|uniref:DUF7529 family protein n=1 Tax=Halobacterium salinarum TaxID=2242 RepID=UPI002553518E|nr:hypothetical protein [Halobacterium salinarum]MDL0138948.1 hypothetical protein [Halobacterium salinarum]
MPPHDTSDAGASPSAAADPPSSWDALMDDMAAIADDYRDRGWSAHELHPGDINVSAPTDDAAGRGGIELLVPDNEFEPVAAAFDAADGFDTTRVFRADTSGTVFFVAAVEAAATETAVLVPAYYSPPEHESFTTHLRSAAGSVRLHVRPLDERRVLTFAHDAPELLLPDGD